MAQLQAALQPILKNITVDWGSLPVIPRPIPIVPPPLFNGDLLIVYTYLQSVKSLPKNTEGTTGSKVFTWKVLVNTDQIQSGSTIHKLTARNIIVDLEKEAVKNKQTIISLSTTWDIASKYTSFVAVADQDKASLKELKVIKYQEADLKGQNYSYGRNTGFAPAYYRISDDLEDVKSIMVQNIDKAIERGERLDTLCLQSESLSFSSRSYSRSPSVVDTIGDTLSSIGSTIGNFFSSITSAAPSSAPPVSKTRDRKSSGGGGGDGFCLATEDAGKNYGATSTFTDSFHVSGNVPSSNERPLDTFIKLQRANGSFLLNKNLETHLKKSEDQIAAAIPAQLKGAANTEELAQVLWATALALVHLQITFSTQQSEWGLLASKTTKYLQTQIQQLGLDYDWIIKEAEKFFKR